MMKSRYIHRALRWFCRKKILKGAKSRQCARVHIFWSRSHTRNRHAPRRLVNERVFKPFASSLVCSLSWNRLKSPEREVRGCIRFSMHFRACIYVHARYASRIIAGARWENCACSLRPRLSHPFILPTFLRFRSLLVQLIFLDFFSSFFSHSRHPPPYTLLSYFFNFLYIYVWAHFRVLYFLRRNKEEKQIRNLLGEWRRE